MTTSPAIRRGHGHITLNTAERHARVMELVHLKMPIAEIAEEVGYSVANVHSIRRQALLDLRETKSEYSEEWRKALTQVYLEQLEMGRALQGKVEDLENADAETKMMAGASIERGHHMVMGSAARLQKLWVAEVATTVKQEHTVSAGGAVTASGLNNMSMEELEQMSNLLAKLGSSAPPADVVDVQAKQDAIEG